jgi:hypothetical protein
MSAGKNKRLMPSHAFPSRDTFPKRRLSPLGREDFLPISKRFWLSNER